MDIEDIYKKFDRIGLSSFKEFIHFGLTSQDITNTAIPYALKQVWQAVLKPELDQITFEVIKNGLDSLVDEMAITVMRTAYSGVVKDALLFQILTATFRTNHEQGVIALTACL